MAARRALRRLAALPLLAACLPQVTPVEDPFAVTSVNPEDGSFDVGTVKVPELRLNAPADPMTCDNESVHLSAIDSNAVVLFDVEIEVEIGMDGERLSLVHTEPFDTGFSYGISVQSGEWGCSDEDGRIIAPFFSRFVVP